MVNTNNSYSIPFGQRSLSSTTPRISTFSGYNLLNPNKFGGSNYKAPIMRSYIDWNNPTERALALGKMKAQGEAYKYNLNQITNSFGTGVEPQLINLAGDTLKTYLMSKTAKKAASLGASAGASAGSGAGWGIAGAVGGLGMNILDNVVTQTKYGKKQTTGGTVLNTVGDAAIMTGNPYAIIGGILAKGVGTVLNLGYGNTFNDEGILNILSNNSDMRMKARGLYTARNNTDLLNSWGNIYQGFDFDKDFVGDEGWWSDEVTRTYNNLKKESNKAKTYVAHAGAVGADITNKIMNNNTKENTIVAFGGPIDIDPSTAIGYSLYTDKYVKDMLKGSSGMSNLFAGTPDIFGFGGGIHSNGAAFNNGISYINAGGSHEENPYEGVQMGVDKQGVPNLVEEGEVKWNDYIFSNRLIVPRGKRGNYEKRSRKYASGGQLSKGDKVDVPYEDLVLRPYEGSTFADAAKKIMKRNGAEEANDPITLRGIDAELSVLAGVLEKERQKEQLREMEEAIDNMSPEEFAMLQQLMEAQQATKQQLEQATMLQLMMPLGMELMQPIEEQLPIAALGGLLNFKGNQFDFGGSLSKFKDFLAEKGLTMKDYVEFLHSSGYLNDDTYSNTIFSLESGLGDKFINEDNFDSEFADSFAKSIEKTEKQVERLYKKSGKNPKNLKGAALIKYKEDVAKAMRNPSLVTKKDDNELFIHQTGKVNQLEFEKAANESVVKAQRQAYFGNPMTTEEDGKFAVDYTRPEGATEDWKPLSADVIKDALQFKDGKFVDSKGNIVENPFEGYDIATPTRAWDKFGYLNPTDNKWSDVEYNAPVEASGNTDYRYTPWNEWFKNSGMKADDYEALDAYLNNYLDFLDDIYNEESPNHIAALNRLYLMGEASKSSKVPEELEDLLKGKNRYFDTDREGFNPENLTLRDIRVINGKNAIGDSYLTGLSPYRLDKVKDKLYYKDKQGKILFPSDYESLSEEDKKAYTALDHKGLTREELLSNLRARRNANYAPDAGDLLFSSMFDNVPAQSYLMAPRATRRFALVDDRGKYIRDANGNIQYLNSDVLNNPLYTMYNNKTPIESTTLGDTTVDTIGVLGGEYNPHIAVVDGKYYKLSPEQVLQFAKYKVTDADKIKGYTGYLDPIVGYKVNPTYYELPEEALQEAGLGTLKDLPEDNDPFPKAPNWPYLLGAGIQAGATLYNALKEPDYSNANALIKAGTEGNFMPISFTPIGHYMAYRPLDRLFQLNILNAKTAATDRSIMNSGVNQGSTNAALLANAYAGLLGAGNLFRLEQEYDDALRFKAGEYNKDTDKFNAEGILKADMADQDAYSRARYAGLEALKYGYAMRLAADDAKANAISAGLSGLVNLASAYGLNKYNQDLLGWKLKHNQYPISQMKGYKYDPYTGEAIAAKGGRIRRKHRSLGF